MQKRLITILIFMMGYLSAFSDEKFDFVTVDKITYELYLQKNWEKLASYGKEAIKNGIDYYYLRMRVGIAFFELEKFMNAEPHFQKALVFNTNDIDALTYLYYCYLNTGKQADAEKVLKKIPKKVVADMGIVESKNIDFVYLETGPSLTNNNKNIAGFDLDGNENIYGENTYLRGGYYTALGLKYRVSPTVRLVGSYVNIIQGITKQIVQNDSLVINDEFLLYQHQVYLNANIRLNRNITIIPAFHFLNTSYSTVYTKYDEITKDFEYFQSKTILNSIIAHLAIEKDISLLTLGLFGGYSNLNERNQFQGGLSVTIFPEGNLNLYTNSKFIFRWQDSLSTGKYYNRFIFYQMIGLKIFKGFWTEAFATFGELENYYEKNAYVVYNIPDKILFKWGVHLLYQVNRRIDLSLEFENLYREGIFVTFTSPVDELSEDPSREFKAYTYNNYIIVGGIKWKF